MKSVVALFSAILIVILNGSVSMAASIPCVAEVEAAIRKVYAGRLNNLPQLEYEGSQLLVYSALNENNGGKVAVEVPVARENCEVLRVLTVWAD